MVESLLSCCLRAGIYAWGRTVARFVAPAQTERRRGEVVTCRGPWLTQTAPWSGSGRAQAGRRPVRLRPLEGPSRCPRAARRAGALIGTSHRQAPVRELVGRVRTGIAELFAAPDGYEVVLGNGGTTAFWDAAAACLIRERSLHLAYGEFSRKFAKVDGGRAVPRRPDRGRGGARRRPRAARRSRRRRHRLGPQRDFDRRRGAGRAAAGRGRCARPHRCHLGRRRPPGRRRRGRRLLLRAAEGLRLGRGPVAGAARARRRSSGSSELDGVAGRWQPEFLSLATALENSRKDQTYNTPALATLILLADQLDWMLAQRRPRLVRRSLRANAGHLYGWAERASSRARSSATRRSARRSSARSTSTTASTPRPSPRRCGRTGSSISSHTASSAATSCGSAMFPGIETSDLRGSHRLDRLGDRERRSPACDDRPKVLVKEKIAEAGVDLLRERFDVEVGTDWPEGELERPDRRVRRDPDPLGDEDDRRADRAGRRDCARSAGPAPASTTSTSRRRRSAGSSSPMRRSRTRSPPPSTRSRWRWRCSGTFRRRTRRSPTASGRARASAATSSTARRSA